MQLMKICLQIVDNNEWDCLALREFDLSLKQRVDFDLFVRDTVIVQESSNFAAEWASSVLVESHMKRPRVNSRLSC